ncbi:protein of unassigned function [Methylobacterium oryzae CBMB20]|uniref:Protein of unassigned function n=1 Tax=Methylobacterium oryzae CBMB20 TaxID=693986 RepID=A0A089NPU1_9HYPH|nr:protein of unassigned function [Methylobacterium oryzae CBMB20]
MPEAPDLFRDSTANSDHASVIGSRRCGGEYPGPARIFPT